MKSIIFAALIALAHAQVDLFGNTDTNEEAMGSSDTGSVVTEEVAAVPVVDTAAAAAAAAADAAAAAAAAAAAEALAAADAAAVAAAEVEAQRVADAARDAAALAELNSTTEYQKTTANWETESKIDTTDYHLNAANKADMVDFAWDNFDMSEFTFTDLLNLLANDDQVNTLKT